MKEDILILKRHHPYLPVSCLSDGSIIRDTVRRKDSRGHTLGTHGANGYLTISINGKTRFVHRLIAETFIPNPENKTTVDHVDRDKMNNFLENLRWATPKEQADNREFVLNRHDVGASRECDDIRTYTRERRMFVREHGHGYGRAPVIDDEEHRRSRERNRLYRERNREKIRKRNHEFYLKRRYGNENREQSV